MSALYHCRTPFVRVHPTREARRCVSLISARHLVDDRGAESRSVRWTWEQVKRLRSKTYII
jgi:hypothetical protein